MIRGNQLTEIKEINIPDKVKEIASKALEGENEATKLSKEIKVILTQISQSRENSSQIFKSNTKGLEVMNLLEVKQVKAIGLVKMVQIQLMS